MTFFVGRCMRHRLELSCFAAFLQAKLESRQLTVREMNFRFYNLRLDTVNQCVWRDDTRLSLTPKAFGVFRYLVEHPGRLVTHDELLEALWPETFVQPEVLRKYILEIRRVLDDRHSKPSFVETLPKRGYQFLAPVSPEHPNTPIETGERPRAVLVGRRNALTELGLRYDQARQGNRQIVFVTGEAGIGKTTLLQAFLLQAGRERDVRVLQGQCVEGFGGKEPYYPLLDALGRFLRGPEAASMIQVLASKAPTWLVQLPSSVTPEQQANLRQEIIGTTRERMVREFCEALEFLAASNGLILALEDLHLVDHSTLDVISALSRRHEFCKLLLIGTYRPVDVILQRSPLKILKQDLVVHKLCAELLLERFEASEIAEYLVARFPGSTFPNELVEQIHRHSDGNALFMVALTEDLVKNGTISGRPGNWKVSTRFKDVQLELPETIRELFGLQFAQLSTEESTIVKTASVTGDQFSSLAASVISGMDPARVEEICETLAEREQFIRNIGTDTSSEFPSGQYEFKHSLYREFLYKNLSPAKRRASHRRLAERMECLLAPGSLRAAAELALHFEKAREYARAIHYLVLASENADRRHAPKDTLHILQHALDLLPNLAQESGRGLELELFSRIAGAYYALGKMVESAELYAKVAVRAEELGNLAVRVNALIREASSASFFDSERCIATGEKAVRAGAELEDSELRACAQILAPLWRIVFNGWDHKDAELCAAAMAKLTSSSTHTPSLEDRIRYGQILYAQIQCIQADYRGALDNLEACVPKLLETQNTWEYFSSHMARAAAYMGLGKLGDALRMLRTGMEISERAGNDPWVRSLRAAMAHLKYLAFDFKGALREAEELLQAGWNVPGQAWTLVAITAGLCELELGNPRKALESFARANKDPARPRGFLDWYWRLLALFGSSQAWLAIEKVPNAERDADLFLRETLACADRSLQALAWAVKAEIAKVRQQRSEARNLCEKAISAAKNCEVPIIAWRVHAIAARVCQSAGDTAAAEQHRERARNFLLGLASSIENLEPLRVSILEAPHFKDLGASTVARPQR